jgi:uncharacterized protein with FMN-binding domain
LRRAILALVGTAAGTTLLVSLKVGVVPGHPADAGATLAPPSLGASPPGGVVAPPPARPTGGSPGRTAGAPPAAPPPVAPAGLHTGTFTGPVAQTRFGPVQVRITVQSGRMVDAAAIQTPSAHAESVRINQRAAPALRQEALAAQSATIDTVSGATYTSKGYRTSLQAALDAARRG